MSLGTSDVQVYSRDDLDLFVAFAGCSLDEKPGSNWVQGAGGLPEYICQIARAIKKTGKTTSQAIAIAVSRVKKWAAGADGVDADTRAKAAKAVAQWEALKAKSKAAGKKSSKTLAASRHVDEVLYLANTDYNVDIVKIAFESRQRDARKAWRAANPVGPGNYEDYPEYLYVKELWTNFLIVRSDGGRDAAMYKVSYAVDKDLNVTFGEPTEVKTQYVVVPAKDAVGADITDAAIQSMMGLTRAAPVSPVSKLLDHQRPVGPLERLLARRSE